MNHFLISLKNPFGSFKRPAPVVETEEVKIGKKISNKKFILRTF